MYSLLLIWPRQGKIQLRWKHWKNNTWLYNVHAYYFDDCQGLFSIIINVRIRTSKTQNWSSKNITHFSISAAVSSNNEKQLAQFCPLWTKYFVGQPQNNTYRYSSLRFYAIVMYLAKFFLLCAVRYKLSVNTSIEEKTLWSNHQKLAPAYFSAFQTTVSPVVRLTYMAKKYISWNIVHEKEFVLFNV